MGLAEDASMHRRVLAYSEELEDVACRKYEASIKKIMSGDTRTGPPILRASGLHPASDDTVHLVSSKFILILVTIHWG